MSLNISGLSKNYNHPEKGLSQKPLLKIEILPSNHIFKNLVGGSALPKRKRVSHYEIMSNFKKSPLTKTKPVVRGHIYYEYVWKNKLLLHCYTNIK